MSGKTLVISLVGKPNSGKTSTFEVLTEMP